MKFWEISQNNSGGSFDVDDKVCHRMIIEAETERQATRIAEDLGCYWDGVENGMDCECCGDRWYGVHELNVDDINNDWKGYKVEKWLGGKKGTINEDAAIEDIKAKYSGFTWLEEPIVENKYGSGKVVGRVKIDNIEQYAQLIANLYGWTTPDIRIFYANGEVKEIFSKK